MAKDQIVHQFGIDNFKWIQKNTSVTTAAQAAWAIVTASFNDTQHAVIEDLRQRAEYEARGLNGNHISNGSNGTHATNDTNEAHPSNGSYDPNRPRATSNNETRGQRRRTLTKSTLQVDLASDTNVLDVLHQIQTSYQAPMHDASKDRQLCRMFSNDGVSDLQAIIAVRHVNDSGASDLHTCDSNMNSNGTTRSNEDLFSRCPLVIQINIQDGHFHLSVDPAHPNTSSFPVQRLFHSFESILRQIYNANLANVQLTELKAHNSHGLEDDWASSATVSVTEEESKDMQAKLKDQSAEVKEVNQSLPTNATATHGREASLVVDKSDSQKVEKNEVEAKLQQIWSEILNVPMSSVLLNVPFVQLGGDSISAMQIISRCRSRGLILTIGDLLRFQTIENISKSCTQAKPLVALNQDVNEGLEELEESGESWDLSPIQSMYFRDQTTDLNDFNQSFLLRLRRRIPNEQLQDALTAVVERHEMLRARYNYDGWRWTQRIAESGQDNFSFVRHQVNDIASAGDLVNKCQSELDIVNGPVFSAALFEIPGDDQVLFLTAHHLVIDLVSWRIIWSDLEDALLRKELASHKPLSFRTWCGIQRKQIQRLAPQQVLPAPVEPSQSQYWGLETTVNTYGNAKHYVTFLDVSATALLMGLGNSGMGTEPLDVLVATLISTFGQVFTDRRAPPVFLEGHGRDALNSDSQRDLSETVGWFTTIFPVQTPAQGQGEDIPQMVKFVKDWRRRLPGKGQPYFAYRYLGSHREVFSKDWPIEVLLNFGGTYQQLENESGLFQRENRLIVASETAPHSYRAALIEVEMEVSNGQMRIQFGYHQRMEHKEKITQWADTFRSTLATSSSELAKLSNMFTPTDFDLLNKSYSGLDDLLKRLNASGIPSTAIEDIIPCSPVQQDIILSTMKGTASYANAEILTCTPRQENGPKIDLDRLQVAWRAVIGRHSILSTIFIDDPETGRPLQVVLKNWALQAKVYTVPCTATSPAESLLEVDSPVFSDIKPAHVFTICQSATGEVACRLDISHALYDHSAVSILVKDISQAYSSQISQAPKYRDYIAHMYQTTYLSSIKYWKSELEGVQSCILSNFGTPKTGDVVTEEEHGLVSLSKTLTRGIAAFCKTNNITRGVFLQLVWSLVLSRYTGQSEVCFGNLADSRDLPIYRIEEIVGPFLSILVSRVNLDKNIYDTMDEVKNRSLNNLDHRNTSMADLLREIGVSGGRLFNTCISVVQAPRHSEQAHGDLVLEEYKTYDPHEFDLTLGAEVDGLDTNIYLTYRKSFAGQPEAHGIAQSVENAIQYVLSIKPSDKVAQPKDAFFQYDTGLAQQDFLMFWRQYLDGFDAESFPILPSAAYQPCPVEAITHEISGLATAESRYSLEVMILASWAIIQGQYLNSTDIVFGSAVVQTAQKVNSANNFAPLRLTWNKTDTVEEFMKIVKEQNDRATKYAKAGLTRIRNLSSEANKACQLQSVIKAINIDEQNQSPQVDSDIGSCAVEVSFGMIGQQLRFVTKFDANVIDRLRVQKIMQQLAYVFRQFCLSEIRSTTLRDVSIMSPEDLCQIWSWNSTVPQSSNETVVDIISKTFLENPDVLAIDAWDGRLTYRELDVQSTKLAKYLKRAGVKPDVIVPLCFEKSKWMPVAQIGVMKAGGACVSLDVTLPEERLRYIVQKVQALLILTSRESSQLARRLAGEEIDLAVPEEIVMSQLDLRDQELKPVSPADTLLLAFTSGSTGLPKGAILNHATFATAIRTQVEMGGLRLKDRVYDFAAYSFDISWYNVLRSFAAGATLCIPSEDERKNNLQKSIAQFEATYLITTPSVSSVLEPKGLPTMRRLILCGEPQRWSHFEEWAQNGVTVITGYGPAECTPLAGGEDAHVLRERDMGLAKSCGATYWVVDPEDHKSLSPIGSIGELWIEGPLVGQGYISDPEKTAAAFIEDPEWLLRGAPQHYQGRHGRCYKTGDMVRLNPDRTLTFIGRQDSQVKIRGQRVELSEVEHHIQVALTKKHNNKSIQVVADVVKPQENDAVALIAFIRLEEMVDASKAQLRAIMTENAQYLKEILLTTLPIYMIPTAYVPVTHIPITSNGKTDRGRLRNMAQAMTTEQLFALSQMENEYVKPETPVQKQIQRLWAKVMNKDMETIGLHDNFFQMGGDSLLAMRLVGEARSEGLALSVVKIFKHPLLIDQASIVIPESGAMTIENHVQPFSLLPSVLDSKQIVNSVANICGVQADLIEDVFPCTPLQEGLLALTEKRPGDYVARVILKLGDKITEGDFCHAWSQVVTSTPILRTYIADDPTLGLVQVVTNEEAVWNQGSDLQLYLREDEKDFMQIGKRLSRYGLVRTQSDQELFFVWTCHHAIYDGLSMSLLLQRFEDTYRSGKCQPTPQFQSFVQHVLQSSQAKAINYWRQELEGASVPGFPSLPSPSYEPRADSTVQHQCNIQWPRTNFTKTTLVRAAWSILMARYSDADDAVFGVTVTGRQAPVPGIEVMLGPTLATVPLRVVVRTAGDRSVTNLLQQIQSQALDLAQFEQIGLQKIRQISSDADSACQFQVLLLIQPIEIDTPQRNEIFEDVSGRVLGASTGDNFGAFDTYALVLECQLQEQGVELRFNYDSLTMSSVEVQRIGKQFEKVLAQLCSAVEKPTNTGLSDVVLITSNDIQNIRLWNNEIPEAVEQTIHDMFSEVAKRQPEIQAICAWDGNWTYSELDRRSTELARELVGLGVKPGMIVPLWFEKSKWMPVAALAVMKAGAGSVGMDINQPQQRLQKIIQQVQSPVILCSKSTAELAKATAELGVAIISPEGIFERPLRYSSVKLAQVSSSELLYVVFTSGSTGTPKGVMISHKNIASAIRYQRDAVGIDSATRSYDFASYAFDVSWSNFLMTLSAGGTLCVPSENERRNDLEGSMRRMAINYVDFTSSAARLIDPSAIPTLKRVNLGGEPVSLGDNARLNSYVDVRNAYGPSECTVNASVLTYHKSTWKRGSLGPALGLCSWIVDVDDNSRLTPLGCVGELWLEGPLVGKGYHKDAQKTASAFVTNPAWALQLGRRLRKGPFYKTGDLVKYGPHGDLLFVGRKDAQVKIRGQRVELGEVEHHVRQCLPLKDAEKHMVAEVVKPKDSSSTMLVIFVAIGQDTKDTEMVRRVIQEMTGGIEEKLRELVPAYMVPSAYIAVKSITRTATGKDDRKKLRELAGSMTLEQLNAVTQQQSGTRKIATSAIEKILQEVWAETLSLSEVLLDIPFVRLGGDSISGMQVVHRCRAKGISVTLGNILRLKTIERIATVCVETSAATVSRSEEQSGVLWDLSPIQRDFFISHPDGLSHFNQSSLVRLKKHFTRDDISKAIVAVVARHHMLRARYQRNENGSWKQMVTDVTSVPVVEHNVQQLSDAQHAIDRSQEQLNIVDGPVIRADLLSFDEKSGRKEQVLFLVAHHLVIDIVSWNILLFDLEQLLKDRQIVDAPRTSFRTWSSLLHDMAQDGGISSSLPYSVEPSQFQYWGLEPKDNTYGGAESALLTLDKDTTEVLVSTCNDSFATEPLDLLTAALLFSFNQAFTDRATPSLYLEGHGRETGTLDADLSETIGWFTTMYPIQVAPWGFASITDTIKHVKDLRRSVSDNGLRSFTSRYLGTKSTEHTLVDDQPEVVLNFAGVTRKAEEVDSIFGHETELGVGQDIAPQAKRSAFFEIEAEIANGILEIDLRYHRDMNALPKIKRWSELIVDTLKLMAKMLPSTDKEFTISDFPLVKGMSYSDLDELIQQLVSLGISPAQIEEIVPCSPVQQGMLLSSAKGAASYTSWSIWNCSLANGQLINVDRLGAAWQNVVSRHSILSTIFVEQYGKGSYLQVITKNDTFAPTIVVCKSEGSPSEYLAELSAPEFSKGTPMHVFKICRSSKGDVACRLDINHSLFDAASTPILINDLYQAYEHPEERLKSASPFRNLIDYLQQIPESERLDYWVSHLQGVSPCHLMRTSPQIRTETEGSRLSQAYIDIPAELTNKINDFCKSRGHTRAVFVQVAWALTLSRLTGLHEACFGYVSAGRDVLVDNVEDIVGPFVNILVGRINLDAHLRDIFTTVEERSIDNLNNQHTSFPEVMRRLKMGNRQLFNTGVTVREDTDSVDDDSHLLQLKEIDAGDPTEFDVVLSAALTQASTALSLTFRKSHLTTTDAQIIVDTVVSAVDFLLSLDEGVLTAANAFFEHDAGMEEPDATQFWRTQLAESSFEQFPSSNSLLHEFRLDREVDRSISGIEWSTIDFSEDTIVKASLAILQAHYTDSENVFFAVTQGERQSVDTWTHFFQPRPQLFNLLKDQSVSDFLANIQHQSESIIKFRKLGLQRICALGTEATRACDSKVLLAIQPLDKSSEVRSGNTVLDECWKLQAYGIVLLCQARPSGIRLTMHFDSRIIDIAQAQRFIDQLECIMWQISLPRHALSKLNSIQSASQQDVRQVWRWNSKAPVAIERRVHDIIADTIKSLPADAQAVCAWDGDLTYKQLDEQSTMLALVLANRDVKPGVIVPLFFEKSKWTIVAILAVMKAGAASIVIDVKQSESRKEAILDQVKPKLVVTSKLQEPAASQLCHVPILNIEDCLSASGSTPTMMKLPTCSPEDIVYLVFTSGSTGTPKGAMITHRNFSSAVRHQAQVRRLNKDSRVFQYASYAFDAAWSDILHGLCAGACICIPSEEDRMSNITGSVQRLGANSMDLTPSVARLIDPQDVKRVNTLILAGEPVSADDVSRWTSRSVSVGIAYGPAECSIMATFSSKPPSASGKPTIGYGVGTTTWVVDKTGNNLAAIGGIGELWLEGPLVGNGYLGDVEKTAASFMTNPSWLANPGKEYKGRQGRLYKTGDLVRYQANGSLEFIGRKDNQVKIHGQRVELGEVEFYMQRVLRDLLHGKESDLHLIADVARPHGAGGAMLLAFVGYGSDSSSQRFSNADVNKVILSMHENLPTVAPVYMVPSAFLPLEQIPMTSTGKVDRRKIRDLAKAITIDQVHAADPSRIERQAPISVEERMMQKLWADVLGLPAVSISRTDNFFRIGGDSIAAMKLVGLARQQGRGLLVSDIFKQPKLSDLSQTLTSSLVVIDAVEPFSLLQEPQDIAETKNELARLCDVDATLVEDAFPCTALQEGLLATTIKQSDSYINRTVLELQKSINLSRFRRAWEHVVKSNPILRTRIVNFSENGLVQVVLNEPAVWRSDDYDVASYMEADCSRIVNLGTQLTWCSIVQDKTGRRFFIWTCHHSLYDGWSVSLLLKHLEAAYNEESYQTPPPFQNFIKHTVANIADGEAAAFWKQHLEGSEIPTFPLLPQPSYEPQPDSMLIHDIKDLEWAGSSYTAPTIIRAAWSLFMANISNSEDVVFGNIVTGRQAPVPGIEDMVGPTISTLPSRVKVSQTQTVDSLLEDVQKLFIQLTQYEQMGLQNIRNVSGDAESACQFQALLLIQPKDDSAELSSLFVDTSSAGHEENGPNDHASFDSHALVLICQLRDRGLELQFSYDSNVLNTKQVQRVADNFEHILTQLASKAFLDTKVIDLSLVSPRDLDQIWKWNTPVPTAVDQCVHDLIHETVVRQPKSTAICAWDGSLTYEELDAQSTRLALRLIEFEVHDTIVPLCFEKSKWMSVAMLAVMKAGAASVALQSSLPQSRLQKIVEQVNGRVVLSSRKNKSFVEKLCNGSMPIIVVEDFLESEASARIQGQTLPKVDSSQRLYLIFTSGSTGIPKGVVISHRNLSSAIKYQQEAMGIKSDSRVYDFASYAFDISWSNALQSLTAGACLCVPSEGDSKNALQNSIHEFKCTWIDLTPSSAMLLDFAKLPELETINLGGEPVSPEVISQLSQWVNVRTGYGPSECTPNSTLVELTGGAGKSQFNIGKGYGVTTWILSDTEKPQLVPIGSVGELWLEGPLVGKGYFQDEEKTRVSFVQDPNWLVQGSSSQSGRCGKLYRTGDLVKYSPDDETLIFVGRKDNQVKIRGQRVELAEVERGVQAEIDKVSGIKPQVIAEVIKHPERENAILVSFVYFEKLADLPDDKYVAAVQQHIRDLDDRLKQRLPSYMIPVAFIPIKTVPMTASSKTDRRQLKSMAAKMTMDELNTLSRPDYVREEPSTEMEFKLRDLWAEVLKTDAKKIGAKDSFLQIGGDSIVALRLIGKIKHAGLDCTVAQLFQNPRLRDLAKIVTASSLSLAEQIYVKPLSLVTVDDHTEARQLVADLCDVKLEQVEDMFPCGSLQEGLMAMTFRRPGDYVFELDLPLRSEIDVERFTQAWLKLIETTPILRTRIVDLPGNGLVQVVIKDDYQWKEGQFDLNVGLGTPLTAYGIEQRGEQPYFLWLCHHAVYDGWSMGIMLENLWKIYSGLSFDASPPLQLFMKHVLDHQTTSKDFWIQQLEEAETPDFPHLPSAAYQPVSDSTVSHKITDLQWPKTDITNPSLIRSAWAIVSSRYADSEETIFGAVSAGRQIDVPGVERLIAPTIATVPVRVIVKPSQTVEGFVRAVQDQILATTPYEQYGLQKIRQTCAGAERASQFQTLFMVQAKEIVGGGDDPMFAQEQNTNIHRSNDAGVRSFSSYSLTVECHPSDDGLEVDFDFDSKVLNSDEVERIAQQFEFVIRQLCVLENWAKCVNEIKITSPQDLAQIWSWNAVVPEAVTRCVHEEIEEMVLEVPDSTAVCAWDGDFTYLQLNQLATQLAVHLVQDLHVGPGIIVPLVFERSKWVPVAMLAVMKAGGASLAMDVTQPEERLSGIAQQIGSQVRVILSSKSAKDLATKLAASNVEVVFPEIVSEQAQESQEDYAAQLPPIDPSHPVYFVFTSGSTGAPKGTILTHTNLSSAMKYQRPSIGTNKSSRVLDLTSYAFDVAWSNFLLTLTAGGCLCIPSEYDRKNNYLGMAKKYSATSIDIVPSTANLLDLSEAPTINTVIMGGEFVPVSTINRFVEQVNVLVPYGPAETTPMVTMATYSKTKTHRSTIGNGLGVCTWIVDQNLDLAPVGCVGELWIEGPLVGNGYYNAPQQTAGVFIKDPSFLSQGATGHEGRYARLYRTGDIVKYNSDGTIAFVGRKDAQLKIRGQRIELEEIEHHIRSYLPRDVVVEAVTPNGQKAVQLTAFLSGKLDDINETTRNIKEYLATRLPVYMIPAFFLSLEVIPRTASDKVDRKRLRRVGAEMLANRLADLNASVVIEPPTTQTELLVQELWASVLNVAPSKIGKKSTFVDVGGDSIGAMRLVSAAQRKGFKFTVADVFASPRLSDFANVIRNQNNGAEMAVKPFAMVCKPGDEERFVQEHILPSLGPVNVSDVYPATSFQRLCIESDMKRMNENWNYFFLDVKNTVEALKEVCLRTWNHLEILRTVFVEVYGVMLQAVIETQPIIEVVEMEGDTDEFTTAWYKKDVTEPSSLGMRITKFIIFHNKDEARLTMRLSHAQYDGLSLQGMTDCISAAISGKDFHENPKFADFIHAKHKMRDQSRKWWTSLLKGSNITCLNNQRTQLSGKIAEVAVQVPTPTALAGYTPADVFTAVSACMLAKMTASDDVVLTMLKSGRSQLEGDLQSVVGPCLGYLPVRARMQSTDAESLQQALASVREQRLSGLAHEATDLDDIMKNCTEWSENAKEVGCMIQFQNIEEDSVAVVDGDEIYLDSWTPDPTGDRQLLVYAKPVEGAWEVSLQIDEAILSRRELDKVLNIWCELVALL